MKIIKKTGALIMLLIILSSMSVFAQSESLLAVQYRVENSGLLINLDLGRESAEKFTITAVPADVPITNYAPSTKYALLKQENTDSSGIYSGEFEMLPDAASGKYLIKVTLNNHEILKDTIMHINPTMASESLAKLSNSSNFASVINADYVQLGVDLDLFTPKADEITKHYNKFILSGTPTAVSFAKAYTGALVASYIIGETDYNVIKALLLKNQLSLKIDYNSFLTLSTTVQNDILQKLTVCSYDENSFKKQYDKIVVLSELNNAFNWISYNKLITDKYNSYLSLDLSKYRLLKLPENVIIKLMGTDYESVETFKNDFYEYVDSQYKKEQKPVSSGGGGGNGGGVSESVTFNGDIDPIDNTNNTSENKFADVTSSHWAYIAINDLAGKQIIQGVGDGMFNPDNNITRAEFSKIIANAFFANEQVSDVSFGDVVDADWYAASVRKLAGIGIVNGLSDGTFRPNENITRQDMAVMIDRTAKYKNIILPKVRDNAVFEDSGDIGDYATNAVDTLYMAKIINGVSETRFEPTVLLTRAQASKVIYELFDLN